MTSAVVYFVDKFVKESSDVLSYKIFFACREAHLISFAVTAPVRREGESYRCHLVAIVQLPVLIFQNNLH